MGERASTFAVGLLVMSVFACGRKSPSSEQGGTAAVAHPPGAVPVERVVAAWNKAGLKTEGFAPTEAASWGAASCSQGIVAGLQVLLCEYANDVALEQAQQSVKDRWGREGVITGVTSRNGRTLLALTDRSRADPSGRTASRLVKAFREQP